MLFLKNQNLYSVDHMNILYRVNKTYVRGCTKVDQEPVFYYMSEAEFWTQTNYMLIWVKCF